PTTRTPYSRSTERRPAAAGTTAALTSRGARTGHARRGLGDVELVCAAGGGLGDPLHGVRVRRRAGEHRDLPGTGAVGEAGGPERGRGIAVHVGLLRGEARLHLRHH